MKIRGKDNNDLSQDAVKVQKQLNEGVARKGNEVAQTARHVGLGTLKGEDTVDISLAQAIHQQLDLGDVEATRRQKVENLKKLVQSGQYNPPTEEVAKAVGEDIVFEILSNASNE